MVAATLHEATDLATRDEDEGSVSMKSNASKSSSSTDSDKFKSPNKKKQRPGMRFQDLEDDTKADEMAIDDDTIGLKEKDDARETKDSAATDVNSTRQPSLKDIITDLEHCYNSEDRSNQGNPSTPALPSEKGTANCSTSTNVKSVPPPDNPDLESQNTAGPSTHNEVDKTATPSQDRVSKS